MRSDKRELSIWVVATALGCLLVLLAAGREWVRVLQDGAAGVTTGPTGGDLSPALTPVALAGLAGVVAAPFLSLSPSMSSDVIIDSFVVVVIGGLGSLGGAFVAAMVLGMVQALGAVYLPDLSAVLPFVIMVAVLIWKPAGFAGSRT